MTRWLKSLFQRRPRWPDVGWSPGWRVAMHATDYHVSFDRDIRCIWIQVVSRVGPIADRLDVKLSPEAARLFALELQRAAEHAEAKSLRRPG